MNLHRISINHTASNIDLIIINHMEPYKPAGNDPHGWHHMRISLKTYTAEDAVTVASQ